MDDPVPITLTNVTKRYSDHLALDQINLTIDSGETVAIIGPSGSGKSTLLRCINGLTSFDAGEIRVGPYVVYPQREAHPHGNASTQRVRHLVGMVFQDFQLFPHLTVMQNVVEAPTHVLRLNKVEAVERGRRLLQRVGLADRADAYPNQLSGGQKQRVAIARALAMEPRGLLCDEITSALDPELKNEVLAVLEDLKRDGLTLIIVTHEIGFARRVADRVVVLVEGKIVEVGPPRQVIDNPREERTRLFLRRLLV